MCSAFPTFESRATSSRTRVHPADRLGRGPPGGSWSGLVLRAVLGAANRARPARLAGLRRTVTPTRARSGRAPIGVGSAERRPGHRSVAARCPITLQRRTHRGRAPVLQGRGHGLHRRHSHGGVPAARPPSDLFTTVKPPSVSTVRTDVVRPRARDLTEGLSRPVVPPAMPAARRALSQALAVGHPVHRAQRRQRLRRHEVGLRLGRSRLVLPAGSSSRHPLEPTEHPRSAASSSRRLTDPPRGGTGRSGRQGAGVARPPHAAGEVDLRD